MAPKRALTPAAAEAAAAHLPETTTMIMACWKSAMRAANGDPALARAVLQSMVLELYQDEIAEGEQAAVNNG